jgi:hypothetical protein
VRIGYQPRYGPSSGATQITPEGLTAAIQEFVWADSERIRSPARVESGRINDPSRKYPGDAVGKRLAFTQSCAYPDGT